MSSFDENDGKVDLHAPKGSHAVKFLELWHRSKIKWSGEIPVVVDVLGLAHELILNRAFTRAANREFFPADYDRLMGRTMAS
jgi:hypothetical protein